MSYSISLFAYRHEFPTGEGKSEIDEQCCGKTWKSVATRVESGCLSGRISYTVPRGTDLKASRVSVTARFICQGRIETEKISFRFEETHHKGEIPIFVPGHQMREWRDYPLTFELKVGVRLVQLAKVKTRDFSVAKTRFEDVVLKVDEERFHVSRTVLANFSSYFEALFFGLFREANESEIELKEIDAETFQDFLQVLYHVPVIHEDNVERLLEMARMYDVQPVTDQCRRFLKTQNDLTGVEKLHLGTEYGLSI